MTDYIKVRVSESERELLKQQIEKKQATTMSGALHALAFAGQRREDITRDYLKLVANAYNDFKEAILTLHSVVPDTEDQEQRLILMETNIALMEARLLDLINASATFMQETRTVL